MSNRKADSSIQSEGAATAPPALDQLDPLLQHRSRLGALVLLSDADAINFSRLKTLLGESDGNLAPSFASWRMRGTSRWTRSSSIASRQAGTH